MEKKKVPDFPSLEGKAIICMMFGDEIQISAFVSKVVPKKKLIYLIINGVEMVYPFGSFELVKVFDGVDCIYDSGRDDIDYSLTVIPAEEYKEEERPPRKSRFDLLREAQTCEQ
jgi:hypothetical protein